MALKFSLLFILYCMCYCSNLCSYWLYSATDHLLLATDPTAWKCGSSITLAMYCRLCGISIYQYNSL